MGIARRWKSVSPIEISGTLGYLAPEAMLGQFYSFGVDYYAVGIIAYEMAMNHRPYQGSNIKQLKEQIFKEQVQIHKDHDELSHEGIDFINRVIDDNKS